MPVVTKSDLVTEEKVQSIIADLGQKLVEFEEEAERSVDVHGQQTTGKRKITIVAKTRYNRDDPEYVEDRQEKFLENILSTTVVPELLWVLIV